jgi:hypothetical protein
MEQQIIGLLITLGMICVTMLSSFVARKVRTIKKDGK